MSVQSNVRFLIVLQWFVKVASLVAMIAGLSVMMGWFFNVPILKSFLQGMPAIRFNTGLSFLVLGISIWLLQNEENNSTRKQTGKILAGIVLTLSLLTLSEYLFRWNLGIDQLFVQDRESPVHLFPGRMSPVATLGSGFCSIALLMLGARISQYFSVSAFALSLVAILSYLFDFQMFYRLPGFTYVAFFQGLTLLLISLAIVAARPTRGMMRVFTSDLPGSKLIRLMLPGMILFTILLGWLVGAGAQAGIFDAGKGSILLVILLISVYSPLIYLIANHINQAEERILYMSRLYATLSQVNQTIVRVKDQQELFESICRVAVEFGEFSLAWIGLFDHETGQVFPVAILGRTPTSPPFQTINARQAPFQNGLISTALKRGRVVFSKDIHTDPTMQHWREIAMDSNFHSAAAVPFRASGELFGVLNLYARDVDFFEDEKEYSLLEEMALDISFALDTMKSEAERRLAEERFASAFLSSPTAIAITRVSDGKIVDVNETWCKLCGYARQEALGKTSVEVGVTNAETRKRMMETLQATGMIRNMEAQITIRSGEERDILFSMERIEINGESHSLTTMIDITERKQAEAAYVRSQKYFQTLIEHAPDGIALLGIDGKLRQITRSTESILGYTLEEAAGQDPAQLTHPDDLPALLTLLNDLIQNPGKVVRTEYRFQHKDGSWRYLESTISNMLHDPNLEAIVFNYRDITERKQAEKYIRYQANLLENVSDAIIACDMNLNVTSWNPAAEEIYGWSAEEVTGKPLSNFLQTDYEARTNQAETFQQLLKDGLWKGEVRQQRKDGSKIIMLSSASLVRDESNVPVAVVSINRDITARKQAEDELYTLNAELERRVLERTNELNRTNAELEDASRAKDEFLAHMSHELRTPLNTVLGLSETLLEQRRGPLNEKQIQSIELIASSGRHLLNLINDILEVSKIEAGKLQIYPSEVSIKELCESSLNFIREFAAKKWITLEFKNEEPISTFIADPQRIKQVLINLLMNAVKFTPERGRVTLEVYTNQEKDQILFSVIDTGIGISQEDLGKLFTPFTQLDSSLARQYQGTGLGLTLVHKLVDLHGGSVHVQSEVGEGSCFTVALPFGKSIPQQISSSSAHSLTELKQTTFSGATAKEGNVVLLADDNEINSQMMLDYLETQGYKVIVAMNGEQVLERVQEVTPQIILMDIQMPKMDGLEVTRRLRADSRFASTPIIALTALVMPGDKERCFEAGVNEYISKPVSLKGLLKVIEKLTETQS